MAQRKFDLAVKTGTYEKDGETKGRYMNVGVVLEGDDGMFILLDPAFNPAGVPRKDDRVLVSMFEPRNRETQADRQRDYEGGGQSEGQQRLAAVTGGPIDEDSIPF